jgi:hypothetical protein
VEDHERLFSSALTDDVADREAGPTVHDRDCDGSVGVGTSPLLEGITVEEPKVVEGLWEKVSLTVKEKSDVVLSDHVDDAEGNDNVAPRRWDVAAVPDGVMDFVGVNCDVRVLLGFGETVSEYKDSDPDPISVDNDGVRETVISSVSVPRETLLVDEGRPESLVVGESVKVDVLTVEDASPEWVRELLIVDECWCV